MKRVYIISKDGVYEIMNERCVYHYEGEGYILL